MDFLIKNLWIVYMTISMVLIATTQFVCRKFGLTVWTYLYYTIIAVAFTGWMLPVAYEKAPSLFQPWFLSIILLSVLGLLGSIFIFKETISTQQIIGLIFAFFGIALMR